MSLKIVKQPLVSMYAQNSRWNSLHQPIEFQLKRIDFNLLSKQVVSGFVRLKINGTIPSSVKVGHKLKYITQGKTITATITQLINPNVIVTDSTLAGTSTFGSVNFTESFKNYFVETEIFGVNEAGQYISLGSSKNTPDSNDTIKISVQEWLKTQAKYENNFLYNAINKAMLNEGTSFNIRYRESFNGVYGSYCVLSDTNLFYWINSAKQIQDNFGFNMADYVPSIDSTRNEKAKFQSVFKRPTYFAGYPFSLNFIYSDNLTKYDLYRKERTLNVNQIEISNTSDKLNISQRQNANRLMLKGSYTSNVHFVELWIESGTINNKDEANGGVVYTDGVMKGFDTLRPIKAPDYSTNVY